MMPVMPILSTECDNLLLANSIRLFFFCFFSFKLKSAAQNKRIRLARYQMRPGLVNGRRKLEDRRGDRPWHAHYRPSILKTKMKCSTTSLNLNRYCVETPKWNIYVHRMWSGLFSHSNGFYRLRWFDTVFLGRYLTF